MTRAAIGVHLHVEPNAVEQEICRRVQPYTMTSVERIVAAIRAVNHVSANGIDGDIVECGVWRGGSVMAMALALLQLGDAQRVLYLYDTFAGMSVPSERDVQIDGSCAAELLARSPKNGIVWAIAGLEEVRRNVVSTGYPEEQLRFVIGPVEETIPRVMPDAIAILRLDTDWYKSTRHELVHLYPRLRHGGILIVDDYGHWLGCREATDEFLCKADPRPELVKIDYTGVLVVKPHGAET